MSTGPLLTDIQVARAAARLDRDDVDGAEALYRRALEAGANVHGLASSLCQLQSDENGDELMARLAKIERDFRGITHDSAPVEHADD
jgi:hypothetical protein